MRKLVLTLVVVFALASVASAVPTGPGGTLYFGSTNNYGWAASSPPGYIEHPQSFWYLDVDSNWDPLTSVDAMTFITTLCNRGGSTADGGSTGSPEIWMGGGGYHNATLLLAAFYNNIPAATAGDQCGDILTLDVSTLTVNILNDGLCYTWATMNTDDLAWAQKVDSTYTPNAECDGIATNARGDVLWTDGDSDGVYGDGVRISMSSDDVEFITGFGIFNSAWNQLEMSVHTGGGSYTSTVIYSGGAGNAGGYAFNAGNSHAIAAADVNNDGMLDYYFTGSNHLLHGMDLNSDGDIRDAGEVWVVYDEYTESGTQWSSSSGDIELVQCPGGEWVLIYWKTSEDWGTGRWIKIMGLDSDGEWDGGELKTIVSYRTATHGGGGGGDSSLYQAHMNTFEFDAIVIPEPATMLLVGSGVLGLAGVIRRRFMH